MLISIILAVTFTVILIWSKTGKKYRKSNTLSENVQYPYEPDISNISKISLDLWQQLTKIIPSKSYGMEYRPCRVKLRSGEIIDNVYVAEVKQYLKSWGVLPNDGNGKTSVSIENLISIEESPNRLPPKFANKLYAGGESGMGYTIFTVVLKTGDRFPMISGNAIDFIALPAEFLIEDIVDVIPHMGRNSNPKATPKYTWCLYRES